MERQSVHESEDLIVLIWQYSQNECISNMSNQELLLASKAFFKSFIPLESLQSIMDKHLNCIRP